MIQCVVPKASGGCTLVLGLTRESLYTLKARTPLAADLTALLADETGAPIPITEVVLICERTHHALLEKLAPLIGPGHRCQGAGRASRCQGRRSVNIFVDRRQREEVRCRT